MKFVLGTIVVAFLYLQVLALTEDDIINARDKCSEQYPLSLADLAGESDQLKRYSVCFFEEFGALEGNTVNEEKLKNIFKAAYPHNTEDQAEKAAQDCSKKEEKEPGEAALAAMVCLLNYEFGYRKQLGQ